MVESTTTRPDPTRLGWPARLVAGMVFALYAVWAIIVSNIQLVALLLRPPAQFKQQLDPGIVAVPLRASSPAELFILASVITLTPGTMSVDLNRDPDAAGASDEPLQLYVHALRIDDPDEFRRSITEGFEARLLRATRGLKT